MTRALAGIFVGGGGTRMGGRPKGLLRAPDGTPLAERLRRLLVEVGADVVLVGASEAYSAMRLPSVADDPPGVGPLGGLGGLLRSAGDRPVLAVACDLPYVSAGLLHRLLQAGAAPIVAPMRDGRWEPLCARYTPGAVLPVLARLLGARRHALQALLDEAHAVPLAVSVQESLELRDWDAPGDVPPTES
jgi:molybdopterin-guanine dinucleotide biosynthesis protein A